VERNLQCEYEPIKPRKRRKNSLILSVNGNNNSFGLPSPGLLDNEATTWNTGTHSIGGDDLVFSPNSIDDVEEIIRSDFLNSPIETAGSLVRSRSHYPDLAMIAPSPVTSPLLEFSAPLFTEFSERRNRRALVDHFCNSLCHLLVFKEDTGNPFRTLVLPLSHGNSPVLNAIYALSSAHLEYRGIANQESSLYFHNRALQGLAELIDANQKASRDEVLAGIMLLVYYEVVSG
jgi:hypothetical protein